jgi:hypothetical protein
VEIEILHERISPELLTALVKEWYGEMVKYVVDLDREVIAIGGGLHADAEAVLLEDGSKQASLWGANYYPDKPADQRIEFSSLINIRPGENRSDIIQAETIRSHVVELTERLIGDA